jgi:hypothetical protein
MATEEISLHNLKMDELGDLRTELDYTDESLDNYNSNINSSQSKFSENFWDEKLTGFGILCGNLRNSLTNVRELEIFIRECANCEDQYVKQLTKISAQLNKFSTGTMLSSVWHNVVLELNKHTSWAHLHFVNSLYGLIKEVQTYQNNLRKKKRKIRENEIKTAQSIENFRTARQQLAKARDQYHQLSVEKLSASSIDTSASNNNNNTNSNTNNTSPTTPSIFSILRQSADKRFQSALDEYRQAIERHNQTKAEFEQRYVDSCNSFQFHEEAHLAQMRTFLNTYVQLVNQLNLAREKCFSDYNSKLNGVYSVDMLIQQFIVNKGNFGCTCFLVKHIDCIF